MENNNINNNNLKVTIVVPIYNVEPFIKECLDSLINQTLKEIEILCIDDCGTDNSIKITEEYAKKDNRIKIIHHERNLGLGATRNTGIKYSTGEYIGFVDSDDWVDLDYYEVLYNETKKSGVEIILNDNIIKYKSKFSQKQFYRPKRKNKKGFFEISCDNLLNIPAMTWCKLYKKSFLDLINIKFPDKLRYEDNYFNFTTLTFLKKIYIINGPKYFYRRRTDSIIGLNRKVIKNDDMLEIVKNIYSFYKKNDLTNKFKLIIIFLKDHLELHQNKEKFFLKIQNFFQEIKNDIFDNKRLYNEKEIFFFENVLNKKFCLIYKINLFHILNIITLKIFYNKNLQIKLFNFIILFSQKGENNYRIFYLFGFIPFFYIKNYNLNIIKPTK